MSANLLLTYFLPTLVFFFRGVGASRNLGGTPPHNSKADNKTHKTRHCWTLAGKIWMLSWPLLFGGCSFSSSKKTISWQIQTHYLSWAAANGGVTNGGFKGCLAALPGNRPKSAFFALFLPFSTYPGGAEEHLENPENGGKRPLSSDILGFP